MSVGPRSPAPLTRNGQLRENKISLEKDSREQFDVGKHVNQSEFASRDVHHFLTVIEPISQSHSSQELVDTKAMTTK